MKDMFRHYYILDEKGNPVIEPDLMKWARWFEKAERHVGLKRIGPYNISTVFLGLDHNYLTEGAPVLWETMIFTKLVNDPLNQEMDRCSGSREQAEAMHCRMVDMVKAKMIKKPTRKKVKK